MRGGVTTPAELRRIADVAEKYEVKMVKVTGRVSCDGWFALSPSAA